MLNSNIKDFNYYLVTFTFPGGLSIGLKENIKKFFKTKLYVCANLELGQNGTNPHVHCVVGTGVGKSRDLRREILKCVYGKTSKDEVDPHLLNVKTVNNLGNALSYISKEVKDDKYWYRSGFQVTWLHEELKKVQDKKRIFKKWRQVSIDQAPHCIIEYCKLNNVTVESKDDYVEIVSQLAGQGINVRSWIKNSEFIYATVRLEFGDCSVLRKCVMNQLNFL